MRPNTNETASQYDFTGFERDIDEDEESVGGDAHPDTQRALDELFDMLAGEEV
jgi:hypothetical protein